MTAAAPSPRAIALGLRANLAQFSLLVGVNALVGGMLGQERTVLPLLATHVFHLTAVTAALTFIVAFGLTKALTNFAAGPQFIEKWSSDSGVTWNPAGGSNFATVSFGGWDRAGRRVRCPESSVRRVDLR